MEEQINKGLTVFNQICEVNKLDPQAITTEAKKRFPDKLEEGNAAETLIWTALDHRASELLKQVTGSTTGPIRGDGGEYSIDADPAAPAFVINEDTIRSKHGAETAEKLIEALGHVKLPVQA